MSNSKSGGKATLKNTSTNRVNFEIRNEQGQLLRYLKLGSTVDDALVVQKRPALGSLVTVEADDVAYLKANNPIFRSMVEKGHILVGAA